jgi:hypothetical protein
MTAFVLVSVLLMAAAPATAQTDTNNQEGDGGLSDLVDDFQQFTLNWDATLEETVTAVLFSPFRTLGQQLLQIISLVLTHTPDVHPNPAVEDVHSDVLLVTYLLSGIGFMIAGLLYITGPLFGISYNEVRMVIPRIIVALIFSTVSLPLLQVTVDLTNALNKAFVPAQLSMSITQAAGLASGVTLAYVVNSALLLVVVVMFILRNTYLLFVAAISPLLALTWSIPKAKRYADTFIAGWWTALAMAPLDMLVLKFVFALLNGNGSTIPGSISNWIFGVAGFSLLILVPYQLYGASQAAIGQAYVVSRGFKNRAKQAYGIGKNLRQDSDDHPHKYMLSGDEQANLMSYRQRKWGNAEEFRENWTVKSGEDNE